MKLPFLSLALLALTTPILASPTRTFSLSKRASVSDVPDTGFATQNGGYALLFLLFSSFPR